MATEKTTTHRITATFEKAQAYIGNKPNSLRVSIKRRTTNKDEKRKEGTAVGLQKAEEVRAALRWPLAVMGRGAWLWWGPYPGVFRDARHPPPPPKSKYNYSTREKWYRQVSETEKQNLKNTQPEILVSAQRQAGRVMATNTNITHRVRATFETAHAYMGKMPNSLRVPRIREPHRKIETKNRMEGTVGMQKAEGFWAVLRWLLAVWEGMHHYVDGHTPALSL